MKVSMKVTVDVDPEKWSEANNINANITDKRSLNTAVRNDVRSYIRHILKTGTPAFDDLDIEVEVQ